MSHVSQNFVCTSAPGTTPAPRLLPEGWEEEEGWCKDSRDGERERCSVAGGFRLQRRYRNTLSGQTQTEYPAFGLTAAKAVQLRMGGSPPKGGRGRVGPPHTSSDVVADAAASELSRLKNVKALLPAQAPEWIGI